jgi:FkbM family methyltransferase
MHHYPIIRGRSRFTRLLSDRFPLAPGTVVEFDDDLEIELSAKQFVSRQIYWFGIFEPVEATFFKSLIQPGMTVIDVGGNIGQYTLLSAKRIGSSGRVHTFEPATENFSILKRNVERNGFSDRVILNKAALTAEVADKQLLLMSDGGSHCIATEAAAATVNSHMEDVHCLTLDSYVQEQGLNQIDLTKIDAEGCDFEVLKGSLNTLKSIKPPLVLEFADRVLCKYSTSAQEMLNFLLDLGYDAFEFGTAGLKPLQNKQLQNASLNLFLK